VNLSKRKEVRLSKIMYLDIETAANARMYPYIMEGAKPPGTYKKPESIARWFDEEELRRADKMPLDVDFAQIIALSYALDDKPPIVMLANDYGEERLILRIFWQLLGDDRGCRVCGFNVLDFDLPIIMRRSWRWSIRPTRTIHLTRYRTDSVIDLMQLLYNWGNAPGPRYRGLKAVAKVYGIENACPDLDGSMVAEMDKDWD
jgi:hypothetical protein